MPREGLLNIPLICRQEREVLSTIFCSWEFLICMSQCLSDALNALADKLLLSPLIKLGGHSAISQRYQQLPIMKILGLDKFGIAENQLSSELTKTNFRVKIHFNYFNDPKILRPLTPKERRLLICRKFREQLKALKPKIPFDQFEIIGSRIKPRGLQGTLTGEQLNNLRESREIQNIFIESAEGYKQLEIKEEPKYFSVQALFAAVVEGYDYTNSVQLTEERILLVQANNINEAEKIAEQEFAEYTSDQYLNSDYRYVNWKFMRHLDVFETDLEELDPKGTEVFSQMRRQKLNKADNSR